MVDVLWQLMEEVKKNICYLPKRMKGRHDLSLAVKNEVSWQPIHTTATGSDIVNIQNSRQKVGTSRRGDARR